MSFLKKLFGSSEQSQDRDGIYLYIQSNQTGEVIQLRIHRYNDLSRADTGGFYVRKVVVGERGFDRMEAEFTFDRNRQMTSHDISGGKLVEREDYDAYQQQKTADQE
ncbi:MAG: hypothetical protein GYB65_01430 [Chloroflexi bacterium]|nr:hypothetical protein [Chloroflexota bacterium]